MKYIFLFISGIIISSIGFGQISVPYTVSGTWTCPAGVTSVTVECWGGGGSGGGNTTNTSKGGGGGAGGAYASSVVAVTPATVYTVTVGATKVGTYSAGAQGNSSWFNTVGTVYAQGGAGGAAPNGGVAAGGIGSSASSIGTVKYAGGNGYDGSATQGSPGGGGAGSTGAGGHATLTAGGIGTTVGGGDGGARRTGSNPGRQGITYGGGGGGAFVNSAVDQLGGDGAAGYVVITYAAFCSPAPTSVDGTGITNVSLNSINNTTGDEAGHYGDYSAQIANVTQGVTETCYITFSTGYTYATKIWVDWNNDLDFLDAGEEVYSGTSLAANPTTLTATFTVPVAATIGNHRMRIGGADVGPPTPCYTGSYATFEDYTLNVVAASPMAYSSCTTTQSNTASVAPGATAQEIIGIQIVTTGVTSPLSVTQFTVNANGSTAIADINAANSAKIYYTGTSSTFATTTLFGQNTPTIANFNIGGTQALSSGTNYFWLVYDIKAGATVGNVVDGQCTSLNVGGARTPTTTAPAGSRPIALSYCASAATYTADEDILNVTFGTLNNTSTCATTGGAGSILNRYSDYTSVAAPSVMQGSTVSFSVQVGTCGGTYSNACAIWIDYNKDGDFADAGEKVYNAASTTSGAHTESGNITIPITASLGNTRMRVICSESSVPTDPCAAYSYGETEDYFVNITAAVACSGTPTAGSASASPTPICPGATSTVSLSGYTVASGMTFQWQSSPDNATWTDIVGATSTTYLTPALTVSTYYRCRVTCTASGFSANSSSTQVVVQLSSTCYCTSAATSTSDMDITRVSFGGINNTTPVVSLVGSIGTATGTAGLYSNFYNAATNPSVQQGSTNSLIVRIDGTAYSHAVYVFFDFNQDGDLVDAGESFTVFPYANPTLPNATTVNIAIPLTATVGNTLMRVLCVESSTFTNPCGTYTWGETEDYKLTITAAPPCAGAPAAGTAAASPSPICNGETSTITLSGYTVASGISFQWQSAPAVGGPWTNIAGATSTFYVSSATVTTYYRCISTCSISGLTATSSVATLTLNPPTSCYCASNATSTGDMDIGNVTFGTINNTTACGSLTGTQGNATGTASLYSNFVGSAVPVPNCEQGTVINLSVTIPTCGTAYGHAVYAFIDFNQDGDFTELNEKTIVFPYANPGAHTATVGVTIPSTAILGNTTMRIVCVESSSFDDPCGTYTWGETEDYRINITVGVTNMTFVSCTTTQPITTSVGQGSVNKEIICVEVVTSGMLSPINLTYLRLRTTGTSNPATDIQNAKVWYTGNSSTFSPTTQFSTTVIAPPASGINMDINGLQTLLAGTNYFWLTYDIKATATVANVVDGQCLLLTVNGVNRTPTVTSPLGSRPITLPLPPNDEACGATPLAVNSGSISYQTASLSTTATVSTITGPAPGCGSLGPDIWFTAVVPASGRLVIDTDDSGGPSDIDMAWYYSSSIDCNDIDNLIECDDADSQNGSMAMICHAGSLCTIPGDCAQNATLTPGMTVYIRVWDYAGTFGNFLIGAYEPSPPGTPSTCATAEVIPSLPFMSSNTTCCADDDYKSTDGCGSLYTDGEDYLYTYTPTSNVTVDIMLSGTSTYTGVFVTDKCPNAGGVVCVASQTAAAGNPMLCGVSLVAGTTYYIMVDTDPGPTCTPFNIRITATSAPTCNMSYTVATTAYSWDTYFGTNIVLPIDDRFCDIYIPIAFPICYDGFQYTGLLVSSNGYLIFDPISCATNLPTTNAAPNTYSGWSISAAIPNTSNAPRNAILGPWHDIDPAQGGVITYGVLGTTPNRRFIVTWSNAPLFSSSCGQLISQQVKLYETTNNVEIHLRDKYYCSSWNGGAAIMGIHNYNGTQAVVPAGYNYPTLWEAHNEAWRFTYNCPDCIVLLPVGLKSFTGESVDYSSNLLKWNTATETNNDRFEIQKRMYNDEYETIGHKKGAGNSTEPIDYTFTDNDVVDDVSYYRLKQIDFDGKFEYSRIIAVSRFSGNSMYFYPNPAKDVIYFDGQLPYTIFTIEGKVLLSGEDNYANVSSLAAGIYMIKVADKYEKLVIDR